MFIPPKPVSDYPWYIRLFFWKQKKTYGKVLEPGMYWARSPSVFIGVSQINHCEFCVDINATTLMKRGVSEDKVAHLAGWKDSDLFDGGERLALELTEAITYTDQEVTAELMEELKAHFDEDGLAELCGLIAFQNMSSKYNAALDIPAQGFCRMPLAVINKESA